LVFDDRHVLDLQLIANSRFGHLDVADGLLTVEGHEHASAVEIRVELRRRVLGELEQWLQLRPGAGVLHDAKRAHCAAAGTRVVSEDA
jgi:hypothetical protein